MSSAWQSSRAGGRCRRWRWVCCAGAACCCGCACRRSGCARSWQMWRRRTTRTTRTTTAATRQMSRRWVLGEAAQQRSAARCSALLAWHCCATRASAAEVVVRPQERLLGCSSSGSKAGCGNSSCSRSQGNFQRKKTSSVGQLRNALPGPCAAPQALGAMLAADDFASHLSDLEQLAVIVAAVIHDVGHPGVNNDFLIRTQSEVGRAARVWGSPVVVGAPGRSASALAAFVLR